MRKLLAMTAERATRYIEALEKRRVAPSTRAVERLTSWRVSLQREPIDPEAVVRELDDIGSPATMAMAGPRFFGFVIGGSLPAALAASWLAGAWDQNTGLYNVTPATAALEEIALLWLMDVLRLPTESGGAFVTGATVANFTALAAARHG